MEKGLARLEGVTSAKATDDKTIYAVKVMENKAILPSALKKAVDDAGYGYEGATIDVIGTVAKEGEGYVLTARASSQKYTLKPNDDLRKLVADGKTKLLVCGDLDEPDDEDEKDGKKPLPLIEVTSAKEPPKEEPKKK